MTETSQPLPPRPFLENTRSDTWWVAPLMTALVLLAFIVYATWAAAVGEHYEWGPYLSPFYSPLIQVDWWPLSPAFLILWAPGGFRLTCYYYRKAYYRVFFLTPPACSVGARPQNYRGERAILIFQNLHRFFFYISFLYIFILAADAIIAFGFEDGFGIGVGSLVLTLNVILLAGFTFGCNSFRHVIGGNVDCYSCVRFGGLRHKGWRFVTFFNKNHAEWAWVSLIWVALTDLYVRLVSMGIITDLRIL